MIISYLPIHFFISFSSSVLVDNQPLFVLRSVLGKELRSMSCIAHQSKCPECMYNKTCAYAFLFETILEQNNEVVPGRDRASHPYAFTQGKQVAGKTMQEYDFTITLFGKAIDYLPYIYAAFERAGKCGLFKERIPFTVQKVLVGEKNILVSHEQINTDIASCIFEYNMSDSSFKKGEILIELKSPLRFKVGGKYFSDFSARDFMGCLFRRMSTLSSLYGSSELNGMYRYTANEQLQLTDKNLQWCENRHYSVRQKDAMELGGVTGTFKLAGTFTQSDIKLLEFAHIANAGKNTNFGLGQLDFWTKWE